MAVPGINGTANYPVYTPGRTKKNTTSTSFDQQINQKKAGGTLTLHWFDTPEGDKPLGAIGRGEGGSMTVYKPKDFDPENPVYKVKTWDADGNVTERMVDLKNVDVKNSDREEMFAYSCYLTDSGQYPEAQDTFCRIPNPNGQPDGGVLDSFKTEKYNWLELARSFMQMQYNGGNIQGYLDFKKFVDFFE